MPVIRPRRCNDCGTEFDSIVFASRGFARHMDTGTQTEEITCECGSTDLTRLVSAANVIWTGSEAGYGKIYPYFDRSLGIRIHSKAHHDQVMKARNLQHVEASDLEREGARMRAEDEAFTRRLAEQDQMVEDHPDYREYRRLRDKGALTEHIPKEHREVAQKKLMANAKR